jgi:3-methyladenine DNA glycosylase/8-oxoguanine DNA glycosylase
MPSQIQVKTPPNFSFRHTVLSHGWSSLAPFHTAADGGRLSAVVRDPSTLRPVDIAVTKSSKNGQLRISTASTAVDRRAIADVVRHILRLDDDMSDFYAAISGDASLKWAADAGAGRLLRSPTVFEDLVKTMCTTNCSWSATEKMVANLVAALGDATESGQRAFPTPEAMAAVNVEFYRTEIRAGYRSAYLLELAEAAASGSLDTEAWLHSEEPTSELRKRIKSVKGIGDYAADNMLKLLGRYDGLALDSWLRAEYYKKHNLKRKCADTRIARHYRKFGEWQGLAIWCDMTERWFSDS